MSAPNNPPVRRLTALVADDDDTFRLQLRIGLEHAGFQVMEADNAAVALELARQHLPDLAVLDLMMEHQDSGFILAWQLKRLNPALPIIMVTAVSSRTGFDFDAATRQDRRWVHADAVLTKPIRVEQLDAEIHKLMASRAV